MCDRLKSALLHTCTIFQCSWLNGPLVMEKVYEVFILYMDMVASSGHVTKLICWNICSCNQWRLGMKADYNWWFCHDDNLC